LRFRDIVQDSSEEKPDNLNLRYRLIQTENRRRIDEDENQGLTDSEKRMGMCAGLREFKRACDTCERVPKTMKASNCDTCGNF
jgi:mobilome CxxCx(11)CxxC protein